MSEPTPVLDPPVLENAASTVESEDPAPPAATIENGGVKENNGQDITMAGLEDSGVKAVKTGPDQAAPPSMASNQVLPISCGVIWPLACAQVASAEWQNHHYRPENHHLPNFTGIGQRAKPNMAACKTTLSLCLATPSPMGSYRSPRSASLVHLRAPSNFLAQLAANNNATTTTASTSTNPPTPNRTSTPTGSKENVPARLENNSSRAASAAPADRTADRVTMPTEPAAHGAPTRQYLNSKVTYHVMEGMKIVAKDQPANPLRVLGEFLLKRSTELEHAGAASSAAEGDKDKVKENGADTSIVEQ